MHTLHHYQAALDLYLEDATERDVGAILCKHLEWVRTRTPIRRRIDWIIHDLVRRAQWNFCGTWGLELPPIGPYPTMTRRRYRSRDYA